LLSLLSLFCGSVVAKTYQSKEHAWGEGEKKTACFRKKKVWYLPAKT
jgi:hypothetical protein